MNVQDSQKQMPGYSVVMLSNSLTDMGSPFLPSLPIRCPQSIVCSLHKTSGWSCTKLQGKWTPLHLPGGFHKLISWHSGCWLKNQQIFLFRDAFGLCQCLLTPLFLMFHYAHDQFWQPKPNLIWTVYSLNEWSLHLLTSLPFSLKCTLQHLAEPVVAARAFLIQIIKTGAKKQIYVC